MKTIEELAKLSDEELRAMCAELCGYRLIRRGPTKGYWRQGREYYFSVPDYPADLNACREAVRTLTETQRERFVSILCSMSGTTEHDAFEWAICDAEARHIAIAIIAVKQPGRGR